MIIDPRNIPDYDWQDMAKQLCLVRGQNPYDYEIRGDALQELLKISQATAVLNSYVESDNYRKRAEAIRALKAKPWYQRWLA